MQEETINRDDESWEPGSLRRIGGALWDCVPV